MHTWIDIASPNDIDKLITEILEEYNPSAVVQLLKEALTPEVKGILVEKTYVDKDYRSTYYNFYAKKGLRYNPFCVRLHFFKEGVTLTNDFELQTTVRRPLESQYVGYMVLRPTPIAPVGRTVLSVHVKQNVDGAAIIDANHHVHVLGYRLEVRGFPYMQQHTDISVCAHAVCWSILRHYSQRHRRYAEFLVTDVTQMASPMSAGGLIPSRGLRIDQACRVFSQAGLYPDVYERNEFSDASFYRLLNAYVESGFPVFAAMHRKLHAITVIGHGIPDRAAFSSDKDGILFSWEAINSLVVVDDNHMPYLMIDCLDLGPYKVTDIDAFIVPLPEKIYFPAEAVEAQVTEILRNGFPQLDLNYLKPPVVRYFVTSSATLREFVRLEKSAYPRELFNALMNLSLPQFVWVVQIASVPDWTKGRVNATFLLDATASANDEVPFFLVHDRKRAFMYDRGDTTQKGWFDFGEKSLEFTSEFRGNLTYRH